MRTKRPRPRTTTTAAPLSGIAGLPALGIEGVKALEKQPASLDGQLILAGMDEAEEERQRRARGAKHDHFDNRQARLF